MGVKTCESTDPYSLRISMFGARSAFTHVTACTLAESPSDPLHRKLRQLRCLRCRLDCYRVERTSSRAGVSPAVVQRLSRRTVSTITIRLTAIPFHSPVRLQIVGTP